ncbi:TraR/DksA C4-type zinc finger protein [Phaeospirillum tilakii]|uniref:TraR/DksA C4-type zinc finger protein n=1 Tax=Phaeospirillum tilakii TaxID=741673 RepID=A0ABW5CAJ9_9PROT
MDDIDCATERSEVFTGAALHAVLSRVTAGPLSNGVCQSCQDAIEPERLRANPRARLCAGCAAEEEAHRLRRRRCGPHD